jgi:3',5'-cyclic AMP phosphodiesterase CpdA
MKHDMKYGMKPGFSISVLVACAVAATFCCACGEPEPSTFRFAVISDTHVLDDLYFADNRDVQESLVNSNVRLEAARDAINALLPPVAMVFLDGDIVHNYPPETDRDFYFTHTTRLDNARAILDGFDMPVYPLFGNHDYWVPALSRDFTHALYKAKLGVEPYRAIDYRGYKFLLLNSMLGDTWDDQSSDYDKTTLGSLGAEQLQWLEAQLAQHRPTFIFIHYPLSIIEPEEGNGVGLSTLLRKYQDTIKLVLSGHTHIWMDFGTIYGPLHIVMAATRFDPDNIFLVEVDAANNTFDILNANAIRWGTEYADTFMAK